MGESWIWSVATQPGCFRESRFAKSVARHLPGPRGPPTLLRPRIWGAGPLWPSSTASRCAGAIFPAHAAQADFSEAKSIAAAAGGSPCWLLHKAGLVEADFSAGRRSSSPISRRRFQGGGGAGGGGGRRPQYAYSRAQLCCSSACVEPALWSADLSNQPWRANAAGLHPREIASSAVQALNQPDSTVLAFQGVGTRGNATQTSRFQSR